MAGTQGPLAPFVDAVKLRSSETAAVSEPLKGIGLKEWIEAEAGARRIEPSDAVIDRVWKAIPGYNGREVDVNATYARAKALGVLPGSADFPWVYRELAAKVGLDDLPYMPIYRGNPAKPAVGLMINVAWGDEYLTRMLATLDREKVKATFFFDGSWLAKHKELAAEMMAKGHELSNHAYTHPAMSKLSMQSQREEIGKTEALLKELGAGNKWFAPPSGDYDASTVRAASEFGLRTVLWTIDTIDWKNPPSSAVVAKIASRVGPGNLILMHPTKASDGALSGIIEAIRAKGYAPGTVSETLSPRRTF